MINKIRKDFSVQIQFPEKEGDGGEADDVIEITGYEHQTKSARDAIMKVVEELVSWLVWQPFELGLNLPFTYVQPITKDIPAFELICV